MDPLRWSMEYPELESQLGLYNFAYNDFKCVNILKGEEVGASHSERMG